MRRTLIFFAWLFVGIQFIRMDYVNPEIVPENDFMAIENPPENIGKIIKKACYPCHSNETVYPWYSQVAPASFLVSYHVKEAREHFNLSEWNKIDGKHREHTIDEMIYEINEHDMPKFPYQLAHREADLSDEEREELDFYFSDLMYE